MNPIKGDSDDQNTPGVLGENTAGGAGVSGLCDKEGGTGVVGLNSYQQPGGYGVRGVGAGGIGVSGISDMHDGVSGETHAKGFSGVSGRNTNPEGGFGVRGSVSAAGGATGAGVLGESEEQNIPGVLGENTAGGDGVVGKGGNRGVTGESPAWPTGVGVYGYGGGAGVSGQCDKAGGTGVVGLNGFQQQGVYGVRGIAAFGTGVAGESDSGRGVAGFSNTWQGVYGHSEKQAGVVGMSEAFDGVWGESHGQGLSGVSGRNTHEQGGFGVWGNSDAGTGVGGYSKTWAGVYGHSETGAGVSGVSEDFDGVWGESHRPDRAGVSGRSINPADGKVNKDGMAAYFDGKVYVTNDIVLTNADCAEDFDVTQSENIEPGTVMVLSDEGVLHPSRQAYDKKVAGVVSGAGNYKPGIVLDKQQSQPNRKPIALLGKVYCKVDASHGPIEVGDLLTTSDRRGHAMKATDALKSFGAIIGKALRPLKAGQGLVPILISLQ